MYRFVIRLCLLTTVIMVSAASMAQSMGDRVRVTTASDARFDGIVAESASDSFSLRLNDGSPLMVPHGDIVMLERYVGKRSYKKRGFLIGFGLGAAAGIAVGMAVDETCDVSGSVGDVEFNVDGGCDSFGLAAGILAGTVYGGGLGLTGLVIGALVKTDQWQEIPKPSVGNLQLSPMFDVWYSEHSGQNIRVGLSARF